MGTIPVPAYAAKDSQDPAKNGAIRTTGYLEGLREQQQNSPVPKQFLSIDELAEFTKIKKGTLYKRTSQGTIPHMKVGRTLVFETEKIVAWMRQHEVSTTIPTQATPLR